ncbi:hypothetical protein KM043_009132 [Ampulex compressa]|nr:hypothetical protein KM043_009132 [Ampulex compressa]
MILQRKYQNPSESREASSKPGTGPSLEHRHSPYPSSPSTEHKPTFDSSISIPNILDKPREPVEETIFTSATLEESPISSFPRPRYPEPDVSNTSRLSGTRKVSTATSSPEFLPYSGLHPRPWGRPGGFSNSQRRVTPTPDLSHRKNRDDHPAISTIPMSLTHPNDLPIFSTIL